MHFPGNHTQRDYWEDENKQKAFTFPLSHIRSWSKAGLTETVVVVQRCSGSSVTLMLSLTGNMSVSSLFPQYLITAMLVGVCAVTISTHFCDSSAISTTPTWVLKKPPGKRRFSGKEVKFSGKKERDLTNNMNLRVRAKRELVLGVLYSRDSGGRRQWWDLLFKVEILEGVPSWGPPRRCLKFQAVIGRRHSCWTWTSIFTSIY